MWRDVRASVRALVNDRAFTFTALLTLALGIGATAAITTIVDSILLRPLPYPASDRIVQIVTYRTEGATPVRSSPLCSRISAAM